MEETLVSVTVCRSVWKDQSRRRREARHRVGKTPLRPPTLLGGQPAHKRQWPVWEPTNLNGHSPCIHGDRAEEQSCCRGATPKSELGGSAYVSKLDRLIALRSLHIDLKFRKRGSSVAVRARKHPPPSDSSPTYGTWIIMVLGKDADKGRLDEVPHRDPHTSARRYRAEGPPPAADQASIEVTQSRPASDLADFPPRRVGADCSSIAPRIVQPV
jgi:hypothetical protein